MKKFPIYLQLNKMDCGPTCIRMIAKFYGKNLSTGVLQTLVQTNRSGTSIFSLSKAAEKVGFKTIGCKLSYNQLIEEASLPCIIHVNQSHFVVVTSKVSRKRIQIADPAEGLRMVATHEFLKMWTGSIDESQKGIALLLNPTPALFERIDESEEKISWGLLTKQLSRYRKYFLQLFLGLLLGSIFQLIFPFLTQAIVDTGITTQNLNFIQLILLGQFTLFFAQTLVEFLRGRILLFISTNVNISILSEFWIKLMRLPLHFFDLKQTGDILQRIADHRRVESFITGSAIQSLFSFFNLIVFSIILLIYSGKIFSIFLTGSLLYLIWVSLFLKRRRHLDYKHFALASQENNATMQLLYGMQEIKLHNAEQLKRWKWEELQAMFFKLQFSSLSLSQYQLSGAFFINQGKNILISYVAAKLVLSGQLTVGAMLAIQYIIGQMSIPVEQLIQFVQLSQDAKMSLERLNELHKINDEEPIGQFKTSEIFSDELDITLNNISFSYPGVENKLALKNVTMAIPQGKITAIVGLSGSGKTTILKLLQKFYSNYNGEVKIGGTNLKDIGVHYWRSITGSVMQDGFIFSDSIQNNIAIGDEFPDQERLIRACKIANIYGFIQELPMGFNTKIGAEGNGISAGQKQRILIARAIYKNPKIILFDEATNALDANNEKDILKNLETFFEGRTVIVVAHRLSTVRFADKILVINQGEIVEQGNHHQLTEMRGQYFQLVRNQLELGN